MRGGAGFPVRVRYSKRGKVRFISHRDVARAFERACRIAALPLAFTEGFSPHPKISFGLALSVGFESDAEYLDLALTRPVDPAGLASELSDALPDGMAVTAVVALADRAPSLQESVTAVRWQVAVGLEDGAPCTPDAVTDVVTRALDAPELVTTRRRKGRETIEDVKPAVLDVSIGDVAPGEPDRVLVEIECATRPRSPKPTEVLDAMSSAVGHTPSLTAMSVLRTHQWIERDGARLEPLDADLRPRAPEARAS